MKTMQGRNGGTIKRSEKGESSNPNGRPKWNKRTDLTNFKKREINMKQYGK
jgi:hypothetical protein